VTRDDGDGGAERHGALADSFESLASWCEGTSPLYERCCRGVAGDDDLLALAAATPEGRSAPHLLLAAVHDLLLAGRGRDAALARFYPTVVDDPADPEREDPFSPFREFCLAHADAVGERLRSRRTQTNAVRRSAALYPAFGAVARRTEGPLSLVEVGASAGLNLRVDRYGYDYDGRRVGAVDPEIVLPVGVRGSSLPLPESPPAVGVRLGLDVAPLNVRNDADARWLRALVWPDHAERHRLLDAALVVARRDPPPLVRGDAVASLSAVTRLPDPLVVCDTQVLYQLDDATRERFRETLVELGRDREFHWLAGERTAGTEAIRLEWATVAGGELRRTHLLTYEQHGRWVRWVGERPP